MSDASTDSGSQKLKCKTFYLVFMDFFMAHPYCKARHFDVDTYSSDT